MDRRCERFIHPIALLDQLDDGSQHLGVGDRQISSVDTTSPLLKSLCSV
jgi:hypothetical protein